MQERDGERVLGELMTDLARQAGTLVRQEADLARVELTPKATRAGRDLGLLAVGGAVAYGGFLAFLTALTGLLRRLGFPWWLAAALVGLAATGGGGYLALRGGAALRQADLMPRHTLATLKEDMAWVQEQTT